MAAQDLRCHWSIALLVAAHLLIWDVAPLTGIDSSQPEWVTGLYSASYFAQLGLVSLWLALGAGPWVIRWTVGPLALIHVWLASLASCYWWNDYVAIFIPAIHSSTVIAIASALRVAGMRLAKVGIPPKEYVGIPRQLSIRAIFFATAAIAVWLGVYMAVRKQIVLDDSMDDSSNLAVELFLALALNMIYSVEFVISSLLALRAKRFSLISIVIVAGTPLPCFAASRFMKSLSAGPEAAAVYFWAAALETVIVLASVAVLRAAGYRLVREAEAVTKIEANPRPECADLAAFDH